MPKKTNKNTTTAQKKDDTQKSMVSRAPRTNLASRAKYRNPNDLLIPKELSEHYEREGYYLHWASVVDFRSKGFTNARLNFFISVGGSVVTPKEIKEIDPSFLTGLVKYEYREDFAFDTDDDDSEGDNSRGSSVGIRKDDLVLVKVPLEYKKYRKNENETLVRDQLMSAQQEYKKNPDAFVETFKHGSANIKLREGFFDD